MTIDSIGAWTAFARNLEFGLLIDVLQTSRIVPFLDDSRLLASYSRENESVEAIFSPPCV